MFNALGTALMAGFICFILLIGLGGYTIYDKFIANHHTYESHKIIKPTIKLHTDGKTIDTIYVYNFK